MTNITQLLIKNISAGLLSIDISVDDDRQIRALLSPQESVDVSHLCSADELNRNDTIHDLINRGKITVTEGAASADDIAPAVTQAELNLSRPQFARFTQTLAGPQALLFATLGLKDMADANYVVILGGETAGVTRPQESTIATTGFTLLGGTVTDVHHILIVGNVAE